MWVKTEMKIKYEAVKRDKKKRHWGVQMQAYKVQWNIHNVYVEPEGTQSDKHRLKDKKIKTNKARMYDYV